MRGVAQTTGLDIAVDHGRGDHRAGQHRIESGTVIRPRCLAVAPLTIFGGHLDPRTRTLMVVARQASDRRSPIFQPMRVQDRSAIVTRLAGVRFRPDLVLLPLVTGVTFDRLLEVQNVLRMSPNGS